MEEAKRYVRNLGRFLPLTKAYVVGSVARGDFNVHSDIDIVVISDHLPADPLDRAKVLYSLVTSRIEPKGFTGAEWATLLKKRNPLALATLDASSSLEIPLEPEDPPEQI